MAKNTPEYQTLFHNCKAVIDALAEKNLAEKLAGAMKDRKMIGRATFDSAIIYGPYVTESMRVQPLITILLTKIELNTARYGQFLDILESDDFAADTVLVLSLLPRNPK